MPPAYEEEAIYTVNSAVIASALFLITYSVIVSDRLHKTLAALGGALAMIVVGVISQEEAFHAIDLNVIFLLVGMMMIANTMSKTGVFTWLAIKAAKIGRGEPLLILILLSVITALASAFLDNVTTVVLMVPIALDIARHLDINPKPFLISQILASNIGGTATLIGDPPNLLVGSAAGLGFDAFLLHLAPVALIILAGYLLVTFLIFRRSLQVDGDRRALVLSIDESSAIHDRPLLTKSLIVLGLTIGGFLIHSVVGLEAATIALLGATILLAWSGLSPARALEEVEWATLLFFVGLFIVVEGLVKVGVLEQVGRLALQVTGGDLTLSAMMILWLSAFGSGIVDNIPYTATMIPVVRELGTQMPVDPLWWSLALGACLGGNATIIGASANIITANMAEKAGVSMKFSEFLRYGLPTTLGSIVVASIYIWLRYLQ